MDWRGSCKKDLWLKVLKRSSPNPGVVTQREKLGVWALSPPVQGSSRLGAGVLWSEEQGLATEASSYPTSRNHIHPAISGPRG